VRGVLRARDICVSKPKHGSYLKSSLNATVETTFITKYYSTITTTVETTFITKYYSTITTNAIKNS